MKYTDLAKEACDCLDDLDLEGIKKECFEQEGVSIETIEIISSKTAKKINKSIGKYISLTSEHNFRREKAYHNRVSKALADKINELLPSNNELTLIVGLGNRNMTPDALGPKTVEKIMVTKHIIDVMPDQFEGKLASVCAIAPSVYGVTGIESADYISAICEKIKPSSIIAVDSLAAAQWERINDTLQLTDTGITPGAGVGNRRSGLNKESLGVPVIAVGIPVVVRLSQICEVCQDEDMIVTPKNIDTIVEDSSSIIACAINMALQSKISKDEIDNFMF